jgi:hypothetical protein
MQFSSSTGSHDSWFLISRRSDTFPVWHKRKALTRSLKVGTLSAAEIFNTAVAHFTLD